MGLMLSLRLLGPFEAWVDGAPLPPVRYQASLKLLALLALEEGRPQPRAWLAAQLWPECEEENALFYLRRALSGLRRALGPEADRLEQPTPRTLRLRMEGVVVEAPRPAPLLAGWDDEWVLLERGKREQKARQSTLRRELPVPLTALRGRGELLKTVSVRLAQGRLVTLVGPGGVGKTRLGLEVVSQRQTTFPDGAVYIDLTVLPEGAGESAVEELLASRLGLERPSGAGLVALLTPKNLLLTLDNAEHVRQAVASVVNRLLLACPALHVLVTSREALGVVGEVRVEVGPLGLVEAMALFLERAQEASGTFQAEPEELTPLCTLLDGMPLALEMAAVGVAHLPLPELTERLRTRLPELTDSQLRPDRHASLGAALAWSVERLSKTEQAALAALALLPGSWLLETGLTVAAVELPVVQALLRRSLVRFEGGRYRLLEATRQFMAHRLSPEAAQRVRHRLRGWLRTRAEQVAPQARGRDQREGRERLFAEHALLLLALDTAVPDGDALLGAELSLLVWPYWQRRGRWNVLQASLEAACSSLPEAQQVGFRVTLAETRYGHAATPDPVAAREAEAARAFCQRLGATYWEARAELLLARIAYSGDPEVAEAHAAQALEHFRTVEDALGIADAQLILGVAALRRGALQEAETHYIAARQTYLRVGDLTAQTDAEEGLAQVALQQERYADAQRWGQAALERAPDPLLEASLQFLMGELARFLGEQGRAESHYARGAELCRAMRLRVLPAFMGRGAGLLAAEKGKFEEAERLLREALEHFRIHHPPQVTSTCEDLAWLALEQGRAGEAQSWLGERLALRDPRALPDERRLAPLKAKSGPAP